MIVQITAFWHPQKKCEQLGRRDAYRIKVAGRTFRGPERLRRNGDRVKKNQCQYLGNVPKAGMSVILFAQVLLLVYGLRGRDILSDGGAQRPLF